MSNPVKCPTCGHYVNPDVHTAQVCLTALDELDAERERRRREWWD